MANKKSNNLSINKRIDEILDKIVNVEIEMRYTRKDIHEIEESVAVLKHGTSGMRQKIIEEARDKGELHNVYLPHKLLVNIREDRKLTEQEKKLAEFFINQFNDSSGNFKELTYTEVKKNAPVDRSKLNEILKSLTGKNVILRRETDYRVFYKINFKAYG